MHAWEIYLWESVRMKAHAETGARFAREFSNATPRSTCRLKGQRGVPQLELEITRVLPAIFYFSQVVLKIWIHWWISDCVANWIELWAIAVVQFSYANFELPLIKLIPCMHWNSPKLIWWEKFSGYVPDPTLSEEGRRDEKQDKRMWWTTSQVRRMMHEQKTQPQDLSSAFVKDKTPFCFIFVLPQWDFAVIDAYTATNSGGLIVDFCFSDIIQLICGWYKRRDISWLSYWMLISLLTNLTDCVLLHCPNNTIISDERIMQACNNASQFCVASASSNKKNTSRNVTEKQRLHAGQQTFQEQHKCIQLPY